MSEHAFPGAPVSQRTNVKVNLSKDVSIESLSHLISVIGGRYGCRTCGLMGIDLHLAGDPGDPTELASLPGVRQ